MIDNTRQLQKKEQKEFIRRRIRTSIDPENYEYIPASKPADYYDNDIHQRVGIYVRVSTDDVRQTTSYELQKKYYEDFVTSHPNWTLVDIYADEGISGTSLKHRESFKRMITDCREGRLDLIITKSVSRFARNVVDFIGMVRDLAALKPPVGVFFESEAIFSLNDDSQMALSFVATMAEEESHTRSRSMETSLRMRLDNGVPLTPKLLGYTHDFEGNLIINPEEAPTVKLAFFMYLYGYSTQQIADAFIALGRRSYLGNIKWTSSSIIQILRNERHCGEVLTRKTYTENYRSHRKLKNRGERPQSRYLNHHEAIVTRDDFIAVQRMLDNAKYGNKSILPELRVIDSGFFKGFVVINPRWAAFKEAEYYMAAKSVSPDDQETETEIFDDNCDIQVKVGPGDFDLRGFEIARSEFFDLHRRPAVTFDNNKIKFTAECVQRLGEKCFIEMLINPITQKFAIRPADKNNRNAVMISKLSAGRREPRTIPSTAFYKTIFSLFGWNIAYKYRITGTLIEKDSELAYLFDAENSEAYFKSYMIPKQEESSEGNAHLHPLTPSGNRIRAIPKEWTTTFGKQFYVHEQPLSVLESQSEADWELRLQGQLFVTGRRLSVTPFEELRRYIKQELRDIQILEATHERYTGPEQTSELS